MPGQRKARTDGGDAATAQPSPPAVPLRRVRIRHEPAERAGGYVLTQRGWVSQTPQREG
ncbi:MAG TPA: hypothetical protein VGX25_35345 [Actinophytocola sp.]|uniref:hypothetical protein n=1 Tax=Actinophytocola sp. TaxID=1872138 RepID=UPI002DDD3E6D|nr:hypothetical protein [Actinophytocola sp.]HEV2784690.1 hypothetical protein [Actinophytocola sp.]